MKKLFFAAMAITALLASCSKEPNTPMENFNKSPSQEVWVEIQSESMRSRAFFDPSVTPEEWESAVSNMFVVVYDSHGDFVQTRNLTPEEISTKNVKLLLPMNLVGQECRFYALANFQGHTESFTDELTLINTTEYLSNYNGTFEAVTTRSLKNYGFTMTASQRVTVSALGEVTKVTLPLKRIVAKIAIQTKLEPTFSARHNGGTVVIEKAKISQVPTLTPLIASDPVQTWPLTFTHEQESNYTGEYYQNLFYAFERREGLEIPASIELLGYFDQDGKLSTTEDRFPVRYVVRINPNEKFHIKRNGYYRINAVISGIKGSDAEASIYVANWDRGTEYSETLGL